MTGSDERKVMKRRGFGLRRGPVIAPRGGEHLYVTDGDFKGYAETV
jgi:hypothetical protein